MQVQTRATLVEPGTLDDSFTAVISRQELEAAATGDSGELWFEIGTDGSDDVARLSVELAYKDIEAILRLSAEDEIFVTLDGDAIGSLFADPDVEAHGLRGALAIAVTSAAILAPATQAAVPQAASPAATAQKASVAATVQRAEHGARERSGREPRGEGTGLDSRREGAGEPEPRREGEWVQAPQGGPRELSDDYATAR